MDDFLFSELMLDKESAEDIARIIIERATGLKVEKMVIEYQKVINGLDTDLHGIRMDMAVSEEIAIQEGNEVIIGERKTKSEKHQLIRLFDIEPNNGNKDQLAKRSRYCQALTDVKLLETGADYSEMPELWSIWILPFDPFGKNRMIYLVKNVVEGFEKITYNDGIRKVFLYTDGVFGGNEKLKNLLIYMKTSIRENAVDPELKKLHSSVEQVKKNKEIGVKYMRMQEVMRQMQRQSMEEGLREGLEKGEKRYSVLVSILLKEKKYSELERTSEDKEYREELYRKYQIE